MTVADSNDPERPSQDTLPRGLDFGTGTGYRVVIEVGLTPETARHARISESTELQLVVTIDAARVIAQKLIETAVRAAGRNVGTRWQPSGQTPPRDIQ